MVILYRFYCITIPILVYLGGFDSRAVSLPSEIQHSSGLVGCIEQFNSSSNRIMLTEANSGLSISSCPESQCNSSHCLYGGTCLDNVSRLNGGVSCSCPQGYGGERCQNIINVCATDKPCQAGGICQTNGQGNDFTCLCPFGKEGQLCEEGTVFTLRFFYYELSMDQQILLIERLNNNPTQLNTNHRACS